MYYINYAHIYKNNWGIIVELLKEALKKFWIC